MQKKVEAKRNMEVKNNSMALLILPIIKFSIFHSNWKPEVIKTSEQFLTKVY